jgi:hypothetical protein
MSKLKIGIWHVYIHIISEMCWHFICVSIVPLLFEEICGLAKRLEIEQAAVTKCLVVCISSIWHSGVCVCGGGSSILFICYSVFCSKVFHCGICCNT